MLAYSKSGVFDHAKVFDKEGKEGAADLVEGQCLHVYVICLTLRA